MDSIKSAVYIGCILGIAFSVMKNIVPNKKLYKTLKMVMSIVMLVSVINVFSKFNFEFSFGEYTQELTFTSAEISQMIDEEVLSEIKRTAENNLKIYLEQNDIAVKKIVIETFVDEYNYLEIKNINLFIEKSDKIKAEQLVKNLLGENLSLEVQECEG